mgnify:CR=1 FL=1
MLGLNAFLNIDFNLFRISFEGFDSRNTGVYLFLGDSFAIWSLFFISNLHKNPLWIAIVVIVSIPALFLLNSRTSLYSFVLTIPAMVLLVRRFFNRLALAISLIIIVFSGYLDISEIMKVNKRMFAVVDLASDASVVERAQLFRSGLYYLFENWFVGDYAGQLRYGTLGSYIHNYLSFWRQFGFTAFLVFLWFVGVLFFNIVRVSRIIRREVLVLDPMVYFFVFGGLFCLIEIFAARSYVSPYIWLFFGMCFSPVIRLPRPSSITKKSNGEIVALSPK